MGVEGIRQVVWLVAGAAVCARALGGCGGKADLQTRGDAGGGENGGASVSACDVPSDCVVIPKSCCGSCGAPTPEDSRAVNASKVDEARDCRGVGCDDCAGSPPPLVATCDRGTCKVVDLTRDASTECVTASDCHLRVRECCECGGDTSAYVLIAVSDRGRYTELVCDPDTACAECDASYPGDTDVRCDAARCSVIQYL